MHFLMVLIALILFRYFHIGYHFKRFQWIKNYFLSIYDKFLSKNPKHPYLQLFLLIAPIWSLIAIILGIFHSLVFGLVGFVLSLLILIYCLDPHNHLALFFHHQSKKDISEHQSLLTMTNVSVSSFYDYFAVSFWFVMLGPLAALLYRLIEQFTFLESENKDATLEGTAKIVLDILDWIPCRVYTLGFCLMGHFMTSFDFWIRHLFYNDINTKDFIDSVANLSMMAEQNSKQEFCVENNLALVDRTFVLYLVILALIVVSRFI